MHFMQWLLTLEASKVCTIKAKTWTVPASRRTGNTGGFVTVRLLSAGQASPPAVGNTELVESVPEATALQFRFSE